MSHSHWHLKRDSIVWIVLLVSSVLTFLASHFDLMREAFPWFSEAHEAQLQLASMLVAVISAKLSWSPLGLSDRAYFTLKGKP